MYGLLAAVQVEANRSGLNVTPSRSGCPLAMAKHSVGRLLTFVQAMPDQVPLTPYDAKTSRRVTTPSSLCTSARLTTGKSSI